MEGKRRRQRADSITSGAFERERGSDTGWLGFRLGSAYSKEDMDDRWTHEDGEKKGREKYTNILGGTLGQKLGVQRGGEKGEKPKEFGRKTIIEKKGAPASGGVAGSGEIRLRERRTGWG